MQGVGGELRKRPQAGLMRPAKTRAGNNSHQEQTMAVGWSPDGSVQEQIDATVESAVQLAKKQLPEGESLYFCEKCKAAIPEERRAALAGVRTCVRCQSEQETQEKFPPVAEPFSARPLQAQQAQLNPGQATASAQHFPPVPGKDG